jgi:hypothetical protein
MNYQELRTELLNKMEELFSNDGTQYQLNLWEDGKYKEEEGYYIISYRIYGFGQVGVKVWVDSQESVIDVHAFNTLPGVDESIRLFFQFVKNINLETVSI